MHLVSPHRAWRWLALVVVAASAAFSCLLQATEHVGDDLHIVARRYDNLFQPAPYAFAIWGVIYVAFLLYALYALVPSQRHVTVHDRLSVPLVVANVLGTFWIVAFRYAHLGAAMLFMTALVLNAIPLYARSRAASLMFRPYERVSCCTGIPFSIYLGFLSVAAFANLAIYMQSIGVLDAVLGETTWAVLVLVLVCVLGLALAFRFTDGVLAAVISWASFALWLDARAESQIVSAVAFGVGILCASTAAYFLASTIGPPSLRGPRAPRLEADA